MGLKLISSYRRRRLSLAMPWDLMRSDDGPMIPVLPLGDFPPRLPPDASRWSPKLWSPKKKLPGSAQRVERVPSPPGRNGRNSVDPRFYLSILGSLRILGGVITLHEITSIWLLTSVESGEEPMIFFGHLLYLLCSAIILFKSPSFRYADRTMSKFSALSPQGRKKNLKKKK